MIFMARGIQNKNKYTKFSLVRAQVSLFLCLHKLLKVPSILCTCTKNLRTGFLPNSYLFYYFTLLKKNVSINQLVIITHKKDYIELLGSCKLFHFKNMLWMNSCLFDVFLLKNRKTIGIYTWYTFVLLFYTHRCHGKFPVIICMPVT